MDPDLHNSLAMVSKLFATGALALLGLAGAVIVPGATWKDTAGNVIQAHGAGILKVKIGVISRCLLFANCSFAGWKHVLLVRRGQDAQQCALPRRVLLFCASYDVPGYMVPHQLIEM
jgi:hypothetical protein